MLENLGIPSLAALVWSVIVAVVTVRSIRVAYAAWKTPADTAAEPAGKRPYASYEEWRRDAVNCEVPSDEVAARTPEGFFERHPKTAHKPEAAGFMRGLKEGEVFAPHLPVPLRFTVAGAPAPWPVPVVYHWSDDTFTVIRLGPETKIVGCHRRELSDDDLSSLYGAGRYEIEVRRPSFGAMPIRVYERTVTAAFGPPRKPKENI